MWRKIFWVGLSALLLTPTASALVDELPPIPNVAIEPVDCPFTPPLGETPDCLMLELPMDHAQVQADGSLPADAATIGVHITLLANLSSSDDPSPLLFLSGGPGQAGSDAIGEFGGAVELRQNRSIILVDQRGTGLSEPALYCSEIEPTELDQIDFDQAERERFTACHDHWVGLGVDLSQFDTRAAALDLRAIREALGLAHWSVQGTSYGSRLALDLMRIDPAGIRAVVLNSPLALESQATAEALEQRPRLFEQLFADCAADAFCTEHYGDLEMKFKSLAEHFQAAPVLLQFQDPWSGEMIRESVVWEDLIEVLSAHLAFSDTAKYLPRYIAELYDVTQGRLSLDDQEIAAIFSSALGEVIEELALGQHLSVKCREDFPIDDPGALEAVVDAYPLYYPAGDNHDSYRLICPIWDVGQMSAAFYAPVVTDHPVLILSGDADSLVPHAIAQRLAEQLPNSQFVAFRGMGHDVHSSLLCARSVVAHFLDAPDTPIDRSCIADVGRRFE